MPQRMSPAQRPAKTVSVPGFAMVTEPKAASSSLMDDLAALARLGNAYGIEPEYWDVEGRRHETRPETYRALLAAQGIRADNPRRVAAALEWLEEREWGRMADPVLVVFTGSLPEEFTLHLPLPAPVPVRVRLTEEESGREIESIQVEQPRLVSSRKNGTGVRVAIPFPRPPAIGYYTLRAECRAGGSLKEGVTRIAVCPERCFRPPALQGSGRAAGVNVAVYGLHDPRDWGQGDFSTLGRFGVWAARALGAAFVGVNPLHAVFHGGPVPASPYFPSSRRYRDPSYLDVEALPEFAASSSARELAASTAFRARVEALQRKEQVDRSAAWQAKREVLGRVFADFHRDVWLPGLAADAPPPRVRSFSAYLRREKKALEEFAVFCALDEQFSRAAGRPVPWREWPAAYRRPGTPGVRRFQAQHGEQILFHQYLQWVLEEQLSRCAEQLRGEGMAIGLYNDLALGVAPDGADAWAAQGIFAWSASSGAPPDPLGPQGQDWGLLPIIPGRSKRDRYEYFTSVIRKACQFAGAVRIDHIIGFHHLFWIARERPVSDGAYVLEDSEALLGLIALESHLSRTLIVGEDLGTVPRAIREQMARFGILSTRLLMFEREGEAFRRPHEYPVDALVSFSTHDLPTLAGWCAADDLALRNRIGLLPEQEFVAARRQRQSDKRQLAALLAAAAAPGAGLDEDCAPFTALREGLLRFLGQTPCKLMGVNQEDLFGTLEQQNVPGTVAERPNWCHRMKPGVDTLERDAATARDMAAVRQAFAAFVPLPTDLGVAASVAVDAAGAGSAAPPYDSAAWLPVLGHAAHAPHAVLGLHPAPEGRGMALWAYKPRAVACWMVRGGDGAAARPMRQTGGRGLFGLSLPEQRQRFPYRLLTEDASGYRLLHEDPYAFPPQISDFDLFLLGQGTHRELYGKLGSHLEQRGSAAGVRFAVWAPNAVGVSVVGNFNHWCAGEHPMAALGTSGVWELFVPGLTEGEVYKFAIKAKDGGPPRLKTDPFAFQAEQRPRTGSVVTRLDGFAWGDQEWLRARAGRDWLASPVSIYELHLGSWRRKGAHGEAPLGYRETAERLVPYLKEMGFTHVELLPVMEHPLDESWGYQVINYYAATSRFGSPHDLMALVDACHRNGIGVLLDWVPGHFPKDAHGIYGFDGTHLYEHADPRIGEHKQWGTSSFNYERHEVRNFLLANALFWLREYHVDGLRMDAVASMLYLNYNRDPGEWLPNRHGGVENLDAVEFLRTCNELTHGEMPGTFTIAEESTAWANVSRPAYAGGLGFSFKWNMGWMHDVLDYFGKDPIHRRFHHNDLTFSLLYAFHENFILALSHDEMVHGKGSLLSRMPGDPWQKFANLRALYGYMWGHPGKKLLFMGGEFGQWNEWASGRSLDWHLLDYPTHQGLRRWVADLNRLYRAEPALHEVDFRWEGFEWIDCHDGDSSVLSFIRWDAARARPVIVVCNFTPVPRHRYRIGVPRGGAYVERLNGDATCYGGSGLGNGGRAAAEAIPWHGRPHSLVLTLPPLAVLFLAPE